MAETTAYEITKAVFENFVAFRRLHPAFGTLKIVDMIQRNGRVPMHVGALRTRTPAWQAWRPCEPAPSDITQTP